MDGGTDQERADALESFKKKLLELREWEAKLKALRLDIKCLQTVYDTTEDNIKALQSVGQIIGEVLKQLDEERCEQLSLDLNAGSSTVSSGINLLTIMKSHRQSFIWSPIRCRLPFKSRQGQAQARYSSRSRHDDTHNNAHVT